MSTHNVCFRGEIRKILCGYPLLSVAMVAKPKIYRLYRKMTIIQTKMYKLYRKMTIYGHFSILSIHFCLDQIHNYTHIPPPQDCTLENCLGGSVGACPTCDQEVSGPDPFGVWQQSFVEIDYEIFSTVILSLPLIQEGQLSVSGERMCTSAS